MADTKLESKICSRCKIAKATSSFHCRTSSPDGLSCHCKQCAKKERAAKLQQCRESNANGCHEKRPKKCCRCHEVLPPEAFSLNRTTASGLQDMCKSCDRHYRRGVSVKEFNRQYELQSGRCGICEKEFPSTLKIGADGKQTRSRIVLFLDHDHETGLMRGLLCQGCNTALGLLGDTTDGLRKALEYLERAGGAS